MNRHPSVAASGVPSSTPTGAASTARSRFSSFWLACSPSAPPPPAPTLLDKREWEMEFHEKAQIRAAAFRATKLYPGGVGELISRELLSFEEFGQRLARGGHIMRAVRDILAAPLP